MAEKKCWICGAEGASYSYEQDYFHYDLTETKAERERLKQNERENNHIISARYYCKDCYSAVKAQ